MTKRNTYTSFASASRLMKEIFANHSSRTSCKHAKLKSIQNNYLQKNLWDLNCSLVSINPTKQSLIFDVEEKKFNKVHIQSDAKYFCGIDVICDWFDL